MAPARGSADRALRRPATTMTLRMLLGLAAGLGAAPRGLGGGQRGNRPGPQPDSSEPETEPPRTKTQSLHPAPLGYSPAGSVYFRHHPRRDLMTYTRPEARQNERTWQLCLGHMTYRPGAHVQLG